MIKRDMLFVWPIGRKTDYVGAVKRKFPLAVVIGVILLMALVAWWQIKPNRISPADAIQIRLLGTNAAGQLQFWATNTSRSRVHVTLRDVDVKRERAWVRDQQVVNRERRFVLGPYSATQGVLTFSQSMPSEPWRLQAWTRAESGGLKRVVEDGQRLLEGIRSGVVIGPSAPEQGGPDANVFYIECNTNGISSAPAVGLYW